ncbi:hypothetical protein AVEN_93466-1 [Araneus ventricosus]|uniref:Uncharacterized protein n=1 Tax=Araneus ventricosus TaxID=182803 RepID=A0A4Y2APD9_ARAVE|nr:hypothetical protein AVEN_93466-1 [Araneus ventricosus]
MAVHFSGQCESCSYEKLLSKPLPPKYGLSSISYILSLPLLQNEKTSGQTWQHLLHFPKIVCLLTRKPAILNRPEKIGKQHQTVNILKKAKARMRLLDRRLRITNRIYLREKPLSAFSIHYVRKPKLSQLLHKSHSKWNSHRSADVLSRPSSSFAAS